MTEKVEIERADFVMLVTLASSYDSRLPYGIVPERIWKLLTSEEQAELERHWEELRRVGAPEHFYDPLSGSDECRHCGETLGHCTGVIPRT